MISALILFSLAQDDQLAKWQHHVDKLAPYMSGFKVEKDAGRMNQSFARIAVKVGLKAWFDKKEKMQYPGLYLFPYGGAIKVEGGGLLAWICRVNQSQKEDPYGSVLAYFANQSGKMQGYCLRPNNGSDAWEVYGAGRPDYACRSGEYLVASGLEGWYSNAPSACAEVFRLVDGNWKSASRIESEFQCEVAPRLSLGKDGVVQIAPVLSTTYPKSLNACHATAQLAYEEKWTVSGGEIQTAYKRLRMTPYNQLEKLYEALVRGDEKLIHGLCTNGVVAKEVMALKPQVAKGSPDTSFPNGNCSTDSKQIGIDNLRTWFYFVLKDGKWVVERIEPYRRS